MEEEEKNVKLPESLTVGGVTYLVKDTPELVAFMQAVAKVEKTKLHSTIERLKNSVSELSKVEISKNESSELNSKNLIEQLKEAFVTKDAMKDIVSNAVKEIVQPVLTATQRSAEEELKAYRDKLIEENKATCIPDLVKGNTKEELEASLKESIRLRSAYPTPSTVGQQGGVTDPLIKQQEKQSLQNPTPTPQPTAPMPTMGGHPSPEPHSIATDIHKMTPEEFAARREELKRQIEQIN